MSEHIKKIKNEIKYWSQLLLLPIYALSYVVPRNENIWLFGSTFGRRFADNPKYFYLYVSQQNQRIKNLEHGEENKNNYNIRPIWITRDMGIAQALTEKGYEAYYVKSLKGIYYCLRGKIYLFDNYSKDISFWLSGGAIKYNFWHGIPLKKIQMDNMFDEVRHPRNSFQKIRWKLRRLSDEKPSHYVLTTSEYLRHIFESAFQTKKVEIFSYPRNEYLITNQIKDVFLQDEEKKIANIEELKKNNRIILYLPTFRSSETQFFNVINIAKLSEFFKINNLIFVIKLHTKSKLNVMIKNIDDDNIIVLESDYDPYPFLKLSDILVTDYSSIYFDYLLLNRPIIFFDYDKEQYLSKSREMYFEYDDVTPGFKAATLLELQEAILNSLYDNDWEEKRNEVRRLVIKERNNDELINLSNRIIKITTS